MTLFKPFYCLKSSFILHQTTLSTFLSVLSERLGRPTDQSKTSPIYSKHLGRPTDQSKTSPTDRQLFRALRRTTDQSKTSPIGSRSSRALCRHTDPSRTSPTKYRRFLKTTGRIGIEAALQYTCMLILVLAIPTPDHHPYRVLGYNFYIWAISKNNFSCGTKTSIDQRQKKHLLTISKRTHFWAQWEKWKMFWIELRDE